MKWALGYAIIGIVVSAWGNELAWRARDSRQRWWHWFTCAALWPFLLGPVWCTYLREKSRKDWYKRPPKK